MFYLTKRSLWLKRMKNLKISSLLLVGILTTVCSASPESVYKHVHNKVVKVGIVVEKNDNGEVVYGHGVCSGLFIDNNGTVLTCAHCLEHHNLTKIFVKKDDELVTQNVVPLKIDADLDLALLATDFKHTPCFKLGKQAKRGQEVMSFGSGLDLQHTMSVGYVSNLLKYTVTYVLHGAFVVPGNSGGPLMNLHGRLVGVNEAILMLNPFVPAPGYCIAIDVTTIKKFLESK